MFESLTKRQQQILGLVIRQYVDTGRPVGSKTLVEQYSLDISPATVRNELSMLDQIGYLIQLHTSAGRIPTELGYRYFVQRLLGDYIFPQPQRQMIQHQFHQARLDLEQWMRLAASVLARTSHGASFITPPRAKYNRYKHVELISTQGRLILLVLVMVGGEVRQQMLSLAEPVNQNRLSATASRLNQIFSGASQGDINGRWHLLEGALEVEVTGYILDLLQQLDERPLDMIYRDGLANIIEDEGARQAVKVLERRSLLSAVVSETLGAGQSGVQVVIGGDGRWDALRECTIILSTYGVDDRLSGTLAILGPTRMSYRHNISAVRYIAELMTGFINDYYIDSPNKIEEVDKDE